MQDLCVIGGGMSGMTAAITAARKGARVIIIEKNNKLGKKIYATGNGKCNLTNTAMDFDVHYNSCYGDYVSFLEAGISDNATGQVIDFFNSIGVLTCDNKGYIYPASKQASAVVWAMIDELKSLGVEIVLDCQVEDIHKDSNTFNIITNKANYKAKKLILACGGNSYKKLGGSELGYNLSISLGHKVLPIRPCLCGLDTFEDISELSGVRAVGQANLLCDNEVVAEEKGEIQFADYGISGIVVFNISSRAGVGLNSGENVRVSIDLIPDIERTDFYKIIKTSEKRTLVGMLNGVVNDKIAGYVVKKANYNGKSRVNEFSIDELNLLFDDLKNFQLTISALKDYDTAQVTAGGVSLNEINPIDFSSKLVENLYIVGEMLDIDGLCGGYNITFAVVSGIKAGSAYDKN